MVPHGAQGGATDWDEAAKYFKQASDLGYADSTHNLAVMHLAGASVGWSGAGTVAEATELVEKAAKAGQDNSAELLKAIRQPGGLEATVEFFRENFAPLFAGVQSASGADDDTPDLSS